MFMAVPYTALMPAETESRLAIKMIEESKFRKSFDDLLREIISKHASMSPELKHVIEMLMDHEHRLIEHEQKLNDLAEEMNQKINKIDKKLLMQQSNEIIKRRK